MLVLTISPMNLHICAMRRNVRGRNYQQEEIDYEQQRQSTRNSG